MKEDRLRIISVTGAHSSVGKTTLCSILLNNLKDFGAIKCTKSDLYSSVTNDPGIINETDKDTAVMSASGAARVVWVQSTYDDLERTLGMALEQMQGLKGIIVEGNSPSDFLKPDLRIFIADPAYAIKPIAVRFMQEADLVVINSGIISEDVHEECHNPPKGIPVFMIDLMKQTGDIDNFLTHIQKYMMRD
ncbi:hypothetical protein H8E50_13250 [bacterium]|nr:hypothetical protein [bacterium]